MKTKIKPIYWSLMLLFFVLTVAATGLVYLSGRSDIPSIFLSGIAICISILAMGLSDPRKRHFKGRVEIWSDLLRVPITIPDAFSVTITVRNEDDDSVENFAYRICLESRIGVKLLSESLRPNATVHEHDGFMTITEDRMGFIHGKRYSPENMLSMRLPLVLPTAPALRDLQVSVTGNGILPTTYVLPGASVPEIRSATQEKPILLQPAYRNKKK